MRRSLMLLALGSTALAAPSAFGQPEIDLSVTVGIDHGFEYCPDTEFVEVAPGTTVRICYQVENTGSVTLVSHDLTDPEFGEILTDFSYALLEGASAFLTETLTVSETTLFTGTWTARTAGDVTASDEDTAIAIVPEPVGAGLAACATLAAAALVRRRRA